MKTTSLPLCAFVRRSISWCSVFFTPRSLVLALATTLGAFVSTVRADLIVTGGASGGNGVVWRFETATGTALGAFSPYSESLYGMSVSRDNQIFVTSDILGYDELHCFSHAGLYQNTVASADGSGAHAAVTLPDGTLCCLMAPTYGANAQIIKLDRPGGSVFVASGTGGMAVPLWMSAGPDGNLYVIERDIGIMRFSGATGASLGVVVPLGRGGLSTPSRLAFGPDRQLYVSTGTASSVLRYDAETGAFLGTFVAAGTGGLDDARGIAFGPDGNLYVASRNTHRVLRYNGASGAFIDACVTDSRLRYPSDLAFTSGSSTDVVWFEDSAPAGASVSGGGWQWVPSTFSGAKALSAPGGTAYAFNFAASPLDVADGDALVAYVALPDSAANGEIMLSWFDGSSWEHRAYWGPDLVNEGQNGTASRRYMGKIEKNAFDSSGWYRLEVPAAFVGLAGRQVYGMGIVAPKGALFDRFGKSVAGPSPAVAADKSAPQLQLLAPENGAAVSGVANLTLRATDDSGAGRVTAYVDGRLLHSLPLDGNNLIFSWDSTAVGNGTHTLRFSAMDGAGNTSEISASLVVNNTSTSWWLDDDLPAGAWGGGSGGDGWNWVSAGPAPQSGTRSHQSNLAAGMHEHYFSGAATPLALDSNDLIVVYAYLDPANPPREIMLSFFDGSSWEHRAFWGDDRIAYGTAGTESRRRVNSLPLSGQWTRLEVPAAQVGLAGKSISGVGFAAYDGRVTWDAFGRAAATVDVTPPTVAITGPASGATVAGAVTITATASDNERISNVAFYIDGSFREYDSEAPYSFSWDTVVAANGSHVIKAVATDAHGNVAEQAITVMVNNDAGAIDQPPEVSFTSPAGTGSLYGTVNVTVNATDDRGVAWVAFRLPGETGPGPHLTTPPYSVQWDTRTMASGTGTISVWAADTHGQQVSRTLTVTVDHAASGDTTPPTVAFTAPASGATVSGNVTMQVATADNYGLSRVVYYRDGIILAGVNHAPYDYTFTSNGLPNGAHVLQAVAYDLAGHFASATVNVTIDNSTQDYNAPTVVITQPASDTSVSGNVTIAATASDDVAVAAVQFYLDGAILQAADAASPYAITWDTRGVADGAHVLSAIATDTAGRTSQRAVVTVNVNNASTPPPTAGDVVWFDDDLPSGATVAAAGGDGWTWVTSGPAPASGSRAHQSNLAAGLHEHAFDWAYAGAFSVAPTDSLFVWAYLDPANPPHEIMLSWRDDAGWEHRAYWGDDLIGYGQNGSASRRRMGDLPAVGAWTKLTVRADAVGLGASALLGMSFTAFDGRVTWDAAGKRASDAVDTNSPSVAITSPALGATVSGASVTIAAAASDNVGVAAVAFYVDGTLLGEDTTAPFSISWNTTAATNAGHDLTAIVRDAAGNRTTSAAVRVTVSNGTTADTTPPSVYMLSPSSGAAVTGTVTLTAGGSDNVGLASVRFQVDGANVGDVLTNPPFSISWNSATAVNGTHSLTAIARDSSGNQATSTAVTVNVNNASTSTEVVWVDDDLPTGAVAGGSGGDAWTWVTTNPAPVSGGRSHQSSLAAGLHEHFFGGTSAALHIDPTDTLTAYVYLDPANPPREIMLSWFGGNWEHRAYWGENLITYGTDRTASRFPMGALPAAGQWVRLEIPATALGFTGAVDVTGMSFGLYGGRAAWDRTGKRAGGANTGDTTAPTAAVLSPASGATVSGQITIETRFTDNVSVRRVAALVDGHEIQASTWNQAALGLGLLWDSATVANGSHSITAQAWDAANNTTISTAVVVTVSNPTTPPSAGDTTAPAVALTAPTNNATVSGNVTLTASATDNMGVAAVTFRVDGVDLATDTTAPFAATWSTSTATNGSHALTAIARDAAGNQSTSTAVIVSVNNNTAAGAVIWMDSAVPANASTGSSGGDAWTWVTTDPAPFAGTRVHQSAITSGTHDHYFVGTTSPLQVFSGDTLFVYVYLDPANPPREVMLSFNDGNWEHRAYWGANEIPYGEEGTNSRRNLGVLPPAGRWVKLEIPARVLGLEGRSVNGMSFTLVGGRATWDIVGKSNP